MAGKDNVNIMFERKWIFKKLIRMVVVIELKNSITTTGCSFDSPSLIHYYKLKNFSKI